MYNVHCNHFAFLHSCTSTLRFHLVQCRPVFKPNWQLVPEPAVRQNGEECLFFVFGHEQENRIHRAALYSKRNIERLKKCWKSTRSFDWQHIKCKIFSVLQEVSVIHSHAVGWHGAQTQQYIYIYIDWCDKITTNLTSLILRLSCRFGMFSMFHRSRNQSPLADFRYHRLSRQRRWTARYRLL